MTISQRMPRVTVEYDCRGQRTTKTFDCAYAARRFYMAKDRAGKKPKIVSEPGVYERNGDLNRQEDANH